MLPTTSPCSCTGIARAARIPSCSEGGEVLGVAGVVLDHDELSLGGGLAPGSETDRAAPHLLDDFRLDAGRGHEDELTAVVGIDQPQPDGLVAEQLVRAGDDSRPGPPGDPAG